MLQRPEVGEPGQQPSWAVPPRPLRLGPLLSPESRTLSCCVRPRGCRAEEGPQSFVRVPSGPTAAFRGVIRRGSAAWRALKPGRRALWWVVWESPWGS